MKDSMVIPDRSFMRDLNNLDKRLDCYFEADHGHFVITYDRGYGKPLPLFAVQTDDGEFRQPDRRDMEILHLGDRSIPGQSVREHLNHVTNYMADYRAKMKTKGRTLFKEITIDDRRQLMNAFGKLWGGGKFNSAFRRVDVKPKGEVFPRTSQPVNV
jgi:hypothetical protein